MLPAGNVGKNTAIKHPKSGHGKRMKIIPAMNMLKTTSFNEILLTTSFITFDMAILDIDHRGEHQMVVDFICKRGNPKTHGRDISMVLEDWVSGW